jgi:RNA polymerase sigma factor for flagellar operon FliA
VIPRSVGDVNLSTDSIPESSPPRRSDPKLAAVVTAAAPSRASARRPRARRPVASTAVAPRTVPVSVLWTRYARRRDDQTRNQLVERYQDVVAEIVRRFALRLPRNVDRGDLATAANVGLMAAIEGFDPQRGVPFDAYCELRVKGALLDELRTQDWLPRAWRARIELHKRTTERLRAECAREPSAEEIAGALQLPLEEYDQLFGIGLPGAPVGQMPVETSDEDGPPGLEIVADGEREAADEKLTRDEILRLVAQKLSVQEYRLVYLKYWEELPMREIGELLHLSESRVWKIHEKLIERLQDRLRANESD